jgi:hypothetical protein
MTLSDRVQELTLIQTIAARLCLMFVCCLFDRFAASRRVSEIDFGPGGGAKIAWLRPRNGPAQIL